MLEYLKNLAAPRHFDNRLDKQSTLLITGGSGFLAQHLIKEIQKNFAEIAAEIRTVDRKQFSKFLEYEEKVPISHHQGDCTDKEFLLTCMQDVDTVFHLAGKCYEFSTNPNRQIYYRDHVLTTEAVIECTKEANASNLVFVSDAMANIGWNDSCMMATESRSQEPPPSGHWLLGPYAETKLKAEQMVLENNGVKTENGNKLNTVAIRPTFIYGEGDSSFIPQLLRWSQQNGGTLTKIGEEANKIQFVYAGNCAHMMLAIWQNLEQEPDAFGGEMFFCTDGNGSSLWNVFSMARPFLEHKGCRVSKQAYSYESAMLLAYTGGKVLHLASKLSRRGVGEYFPSLGAVRIAGGLNFLFNVTKARLMFDWHPAYNAEEAMKRTVKWFKEK